jgi:hypothetical protein
MERETLCTCCEKQVKVDWANRMENHKRRVVINCYGNTVEMTCEGSYRHNWQVVG